MSERHYGADTTKAMPIGENYETFKRHGLTRGDSILLHAGSIASRLAKLEAENDRLNGTVQNFASVVVRHGRVVKAAVRASAELRHAYRDAEIDRNLVARAIEILEHATAALDRKEPTNG